MRKFLSILLCSSIAAVPGVSAESSPKAALLQPDKQKVTQSLDELSLASENENLALYYSEDADLFALKNRRNGYVWWSAPPKAFADETASALNQAENASSFTLTARDLESRTQNVERSAEGSVKISKVKTENGLSLRYDFTKSGVEIPVTLTLKEDCLAAEIDTAEIAENGELKAESLTFLRAFGAAGPEEQGAFVIPDGCGALIDFPSSKSAAAYSAEVYGADPTAVSATAAQPSETVSLPVIGILKGENALMVTVEKGDGSCEILADTAAQSASAYSRCGFSFRLRESDSYYLGTEDNRAFDTLSEEIPERILKVLYYPVDAESEYNSDGGEELDFVDIAACYRAYLVRERGLSPRQESAAVRLNFVCGYLEQRQFLGLPYKAKAAAADFSEIENILNELEGKGLEDYAVTLWNSTDAAISGKVERKAKPAKVLGGEKAFSHLREYLSERETELCAGTDNLYFTTGKGFFTLLDGTVRVSGAFARAGDYDLVYGLPVSGSKKRAPLSPKAYGEVFADIAENYPAAGISTVSFGSLASRLVSDFSKDGVIRDETEEILVSGFEQFRETGGKVVSYRPGAFLLPCSDILAGLPIESSGCDIFDADVPFYQAVCSGALPYSCESANAKASPETALVKTLLTGGAPAFTLTGEDVSGFEDSPLEALCYAGTDSETLNQIALRSAAAQKVMDAVNGSAMTSFTEENGVFTVLFENGAEIAANPDKKTVTVNGEELEF